MPGSPCEIDIQSYIMQIVYYITHVLLLHFIYTLNTNQSINQSINHFIYMLEYILLLD